MRMWLARSSVVAFTAFAAACVPSTFDHITGGKASSDGPGVHENDSNKIDPTIAAPRPTSPLSTSYVNTTKPHFKWSLPDGTKGATIELSQTRDFATVEHRYVATGSDFVATDDLTAGPWFWRLTGRSDTNPGENQSPIWVVYVRGGGPLGASETPHMGIMDFDGNGHPDLAITTMEKDIGSGGDDDDDSSGVGGAPGPALWLIVAKSDDTYQPEDNSIVNAVGTITPQVAATDIDGDGYGDVMISDLYGPGPNEPADPIEGFIFPYLGGPNGQSSSYGNELFQQPFTEQPALAAGDFNGDGYGDISVAFTNFGAAMIGNAGGGGAMMAFASAAMQPNPVTSGARAIASADFNGDGINDVAYTPFDAVSPIRMSNGGTSQFDPPNALSFQTTNMPTRATAIGAGDFDGDGVDDIAFTTTLGGKNAICIHGSTDGTFNEKACWTSTTADAAADFGIGLLTADMDADGKDELLVVSKSGLISLTHSGTGKGFTGDDSLFTPTPLVPTIKPTSGTSVSVLYPGRPGPARWAAYNSDGKSFDIYTGTTVSQHVDLSSDPDFVSLGATIR